MLTKFATVCCLVASTAANAALVEVGKDMNMVVLADTNTVSVSRDGNVSITFKMIFSAPREQRDAGLGEKVAALYRQDTFNCSNGTAKIDRATWVGVTNRVKTFSNELSGFVVVNDGTVWKDMYNAACNSYIANMQ